MSLCNDFYTVWTDTVTSNIPTTRSYRTVVNPSDPGCEPSAIRVKFEATTGNIVITGASVGQAAGSGNYETGKFERLTFDGGNNGVTVSSGTSKWTDWVPYSHFDGTQIYVHFDCSAGSSASYGVSGEAWRKDGVYTDAMVEVLSGYIHASYDYAVVEVEIGPIAIFVDEDVLALTTAAPKIIQYPSEARFEIADLESLLVVEDYHVPCGHWHNGQSDSPIWTFNPQFTLPYPYHEETDSTRVCGHWHKQSVASPPCIEYFTEFKTSGAVYREAGYSPDERFISVGADQSSSFGGRFYACMSEAGTIFKFNQMTMAVEESTTFAAADVKEFKQIIYYNGQIHALVSRDGYYGSWIQKIDIPANDSGLDFTLSGDPLYCGSVTTGTDGNLYGAYWGQDQQNFSNLLKPVTGALWNVNWEQIPAGYTYAIDLYTDYALRTPPTTVGGHLVNFQIIPDVGYVVTCGPLSSFAIYYPNVSVIDFNGAWQNSYDKIMSIGPSQTKVDPNDNSRFVSFYHGGAGSDLNMVIFTYNPSTVTTYPVSGMVDGDGNPRDNAIYHCQTAWHTNGYIYNLHALYSDFALRIVSLNFNSGVVSHQYWWDPIASPDLCGFVILGDYVYVWQNAITSGDQWISRIYKLTLKLEFVCWYDCPGFLSDIYRETGGSLNTDGLWLYNFASNNNHSVYGVTKYNPNPTIPVFEEAHDPRWPFNKQVDKF